MKKLLFTLICLFISYLSFSQNKTTLDQRWTQLLDKAENYDPYKVIKKGDLADFWKGVQDSLQSHRKEMKADKQTVSVQQSEISQLKSQVNELTQALAQNESDKNSVSFLGIKANKIAYLSTLTFLLIGAIVGIVILFSMFKNSNSITSQKISAYNTLSKEFDEYKMSKIEMERKLRRELQTQINKLEDLKKANG